MMLSVASEQTAKPLAERYTSIFIVSALIINCKVTQTCSHQKLCTTEMFFREWKSALLNLFDNKFKQNFPEKSAFYWSLGKI